MTFFIAERIATATVRERPPGLIQHVLTVLFSGPGCCSCPGFHLRLGTSDCSRGLAFCFMGTWTFAWICCPQRPLPPVQKRDAQHMFLQHRGRKRRYSARNSGAGNGLADFMGAWHFWFLLLENPPCPLHASIGGRGRVWKGAVEVPMLFLRTWGFSRSKAC